MSAIESSLLSMPEWYRSERETEKVINKLNHIKELDYYLNNPDEYIRRLAIIRLQKLVSRESVYLLKDFLDSPAESEENKALAAWAIKTFSDKQDALFFLNNKYAGRFSGKESIEELFPVIYENIASSVRFDFSSSHSYSALKLDDEETALEREHFFETSFDFKEWRSLFIKTFFRNLAAGLLSVPGILFKIPKNLLGRFKRPAAQRSRAHTAGRQETGSHNNGEEGLFAKSEEGYGRNGYYALSREMRRKKPGLWTLLKRGGFQFLYILLFPVRFLLKHKAASLCVAALIYFLLASTDYGRALTTKYFNVDLKQFQTTAVEKAKTTTRQALLEFNHFTGISDWEKKKGSDTKGASKTMMASDISSNKKDNRYMVISQNGLNIRKQPDPDSGKVGSDPLLYGSTVTYLSKSEKDPEGRLWYYIKADDGRTGWVSAKYLY